MEKLLINKYPATRWNDATPLGNGVLGASVYGCVYDERILINHEALFNWCEDKDIPDISSSLAEVRKLMDEGKYKEAESYYTNRLEEKGYRPSSGKYYPALDLHLLFENKDAFKNYKRTLDMENGICTVEYTDDGNKCKREVFASQTDKAVIIKISSEKPTNLRLALEKHDLADLPDSGGASEQKTTPLDDGIYAEFTTQGGLKYSGLLKILKTDGQISQGKSKKRKIDMSGDASFNGFLEVSHTCELVLAIYVVDDLNNNDELYGVINSLPLDFDLLFNRHRDAFSSFFNRTRLTLSKTDNTSIEKLMLDAYDGEISPALSEKMADFGRYLLISSSVNCNFPANLQGIWNGEYSPAWACTYFNNENIQMAYWQACRGGLCESLLPLFNLYDKFKEDYRENARKLYGCRGMLLPLFMDNGCGKKKNLQPHVLYWTGSSAWISAIYYEYYLYTKDEAFLRERAYPFMKECALFYEDFYVYDENGKLKSYPSDSPENRPNGLFDGGGEISVCINPTMDFALLKELLSNLVDSAKLLKIDSEKIVEWQKMLRAIPEYEINEDGAVKEWLHKDFLDNYHHRHQSHIYPLFPAYEVDKDSGMLFDAMSVAVEKRLIIGLKEQTGWSLSHMANIYARLKNGEGAKKCLDLLLRFCTGPNLFTYHNDWRNMGVTLKYMHAGKAPFQIDANMGFTAAVYEMLLFSSPSGKLEALPALPKEWEFGEVSGLYTQSGAIISIKWDKDCAVVKALATRDCNFEISSIAYPKMLTQINEKGAKSVHLNAGEEITIKFAK
ncbi:MAG: glycoside hydrolase N-terminal domain-containing protein [Clostridia bacterium]|nr:glycoside hydrolase N-terminal domain-containing protein [Clostridia bacterium]